VPYARSSGTSRAVIVVVALVVGVALVGGLVLLIARAGGDDDFQAPDPPPAATPDQGAELTALAQDCYEGSMEACDDVFRDSPLGSELEDYGNTCGGRMPEPRGRYCVNAIDDPLPPEG
jgi:hypothetical protein